MMPESKGHAFHVHMEKHDAETGVKFPYTGLRMGSKRQEHLQNAPAFYNLCT